ncbi:unnamed protein product [Durusdinium trenchii]|uniref:Uncharacterized protein n=1 Tax=Durusdinium trenchii TaxID=1381693 RepID=A0ABP0R1P1_9DINO
MLRRWHRVLLALSALWCIVRPRETFLRPPSQVPRGFRSVAVVPSEGLASLQAKPSDLRKRALQNWARCTLDQLHGFALHLGLFCVTEEYVRLGYLGGQPASAGQPVNILEQLPLQGLGGESLSLM